MFLCYFLERFTILCLKGPLYSHSSNKTFSNPGIRSLWFIEFGALKGFNKFVESWDIRTESDIKDYTDYFADKTMVEENYALAIQVI